NIRHIQKRRIRIRRRRLVFLCAGLHAGLGRRGFDQLLGKNLRLNGLLLRLGGRRGRGLGGFGFGLLDGGGRRHGFGSGLHGLGFRFLGFRLFGRRLLGRRGCLFGRGLVGGLRRRLHRFLLGSCLG